MTTPAALLAPSRQPHGFSKPHPAQQHQFEIELQQGAQGFAAENVSRVLVGLGVRFLQCPVRCASICEVPPSVIGSTLKSHLSPDGVGRSPGDASWATKPAVPRGRERQLLPQQAGSSGLGTPHTRYITTTSHLVPVWEAWCPCWLKKIDKTKRKINIGEDDYLLEKRICAHKRPHFVPNPSLKFLAGPWHLESADTDFPWFGLDPGRNLKSRKCPLLNLILTTLR